MEVIQIFCSYSLSVCVIKTWKDYYKRYLFYFLKGYVLLRSKEVVGGVVMVV